MSGPKSRLTNYKAKHALWSFLFLFVGLIVYGLMAWLLSSVQARAEGPSFFARPAAGTANDYSIQRIAGPLVRALPLALLLAIPAALLLARHAMRPLRRLGEQLRAASETNSTLIEPNPALGEEYRAAASLMNAAIAKANASLETEKRFTSDASHELNTPLAIMMAKLELAVQQEDLNEQTREMCGELLDQVAQLKNLTESLLLLSRSDNGRLKVRDELLDITAMVGELADDMRMLSPNVEITVLGPASQIEIRGDSLLIQRVLHNLASNAIKYTVEKGRIEIKFKESETEVWLQFSNQGRGISEEHAERIFERFFRGDASRSRKTGGLGLGLNMSREIARAHGGDLVLAASNPDGWTSFLLRLPKQPGEKRKSSGSKEAPPVAS